MEPRRPLALRVPGWLLAWLLVPLGLVALPTAAFLLAIGGGAATVVAGLVFVGYPAAIVLWVYARRADTVRMAWVLAGIGILVLLVVSFRPVVGIALAFYEEWKETQPGGRGYYP